MTFNRLVLLPAFLIFVGMPATAVLGSEHTDTQAVSISTNRNQEESNALETVKRQFREYYLVQSNSAFEAAKSLAAKLNSDGAWPDIDYKSNQRASWPALEHSSRISALATAMANAKNPADRSLLEDAIHLAFEYWIKNDFQCPNWWHNEIGVPQRMGVAAIVLEEKLTKREFDYLTGTLLPRSKIGMTGQNKVWLAGNTLVNGLLQNDNAKVKNAASVIFSELIVTTEEGIQPDFSFHQHGPQLQFGNYGLAFADEQLKWATILGNTDFALPSEKTSILRNYLLDGLQWCVWRGSMDIGSCGRQISQGSPISKGNGVLYRMSKIAKIDPAYASHYEACTKRNQPMAINDLIGTKYFWRSDYLVNRREDICYTLKMCSNRVIGTESINSENLSGYHLADGVLYLYKTGDEYKDIFPLWDWRKLPGTTCAQKHGPLPSFINYKIDSTFVGGVEDGSNACAVLDYRRDGVTAKKSWFFIGDQVICLGSAINSDSSIDAPVTTSVNQCHLRGDVRVTINNKQEKIARGSHNITNPASIEHDGMIYKFLQPHSVVLSNETKTGHWSKIHKTSATPKDDVSGDVFTLLIRHGVQPQNSSYAYSISEIKSKLPEPQVLSNTDRLQAVKADKVVGSVFYAPGNLEYAPGKLLEVNAPCLALLDLSITKPHITISDPSQSLKTIVINLNGKKISVTLPSGGEAGKSVSVDI